MLMASSAEYPKCAATSEKRPLSSSDTRASPVIISARTPKNTPILSGSRLKRHS